MNSELSIEQILECYVEACSNLNFDIFQPLLDDPRIEALFPSKKNFERYIRSLMRDLRAEGFKKLYLKIEEFDYLEPGAKEYNFYHPSYKYPRLNTEVTLKEGKIILCALPF